MSVNDAQYAVIFTSRRSNGDDEAYAKMTSRMVELARSQPGFVHLDSARGADGKGITVSYWTSLESITAWKNNAEHLVAQRLGKQKWYESFTVKVCRIER